MLGLNEDAAIIKSAQKGDEKAWDILVKKYSKVVWSATSSFKFSFEEREDTVQDVFLKLIRNINNYNPGKASFSTFITIITKRTSIDKIRKIVRRPEDPFPPEDLEKLSLPSTKDPSSEEVEEMIDSLEKTINEKLTNEQRLAIELRYFKKCSYPQIARIMNRDEHWVKNTLHRTKSYLRQLVVNETEDRRKK